MRQTDVAKLGLSLEKWKWKMVVELYFEWVNEGLFVYFQQHFDADLVRAVLLAAP